MKPSKNPSVGHEPHVQKSSKPVHDPLVDEAPGLDFRARSFSAENDHDVEHTVWDEPGVGGLATKPSQDNLTYENWLTRKMDDWSESRAWQMTLLLAFVSGPCALVAIFFGGAGSPSVTSFLTRCLFLPLITEICKIAVLLWVVEKRPYYFTSWFQIFFCTVSSAVVFVTAYNLIAHCFFPPTRFELVFDWSAYLLMHLTTAFLCATGLELVWRRAIVRKEPPRLENSYRWFISAFAVHAVFATAIFAMEVWKELEKANGFPI